MKRNKNKYNNTKKIFNLEKKFSKENSFSLLEVVSIVLAFSVLSGVITGYIVYMLNGNHLLLDSGAQDLVDTYNKITNDYYKDVDKKSLTDTAVNAMFEFLGEKYSVYLDTNGTEQLSDKLDGSYKGVGISIVKIENKVTILDVFAETPAEKAGLKVNDVILQVDDHVVTDDESLDDLSEMLKEKDNIKIKVQRDNKVKEFNIEVKKIDVPVVTSKTFDKNNKKIGYVYLSSFSSTSSKQFKTALERLEKDKIESLIIDVRSNTGGYLQSADDIASMFIKKGKILYALDSNTEKVIYRDKTNEYRDYDIVVLIDGITASASEVLAAALKESYGAILVGGQSYGKGRVQQINTLSDKTMIKYTTGRWFTPSGDTIDEIGLVPGVKVNLTTKYAKEPTDENDDQLQKALEILSK